MNVLWIPIFSMRSYADGKYAILKDGNFQLTMARVLASNFKSITITVPTESSDFDDLVERYKGLEAVQFIQVPYGANAVETREQFWRMNYAWICAQYEIEGNWDVLITDITGYGGAKPVVYNFNITKLPELNRPYIDRFFETDLKSIEQSLFTTVLNPRQREYILEVRPDLLDKVIVDTKCAHADLLPDHKVWPADPKMIFWPFRISDKAYQFAEFIDAFESLGLHDDGWHVVITDPNDTLAVTRPYITAIKPTKEQYYRILASQPIVVMLDDIDTVLHPGTIEFFHYGCPVITFSSNLIPNLNTIPDLRWIREELEDLEYNRVNVSPFVYSHGEIDSLYNEDFISVRSY
jgi:hypothetical protein